MTPMTQWNIIGKTCKYLSNSYTIKTVNLVKTGTISEKLATYKNTIEEDT